MRGSNDLTQARRRVGLAFSICLVSACGSAAGQEDEQNQAMAKAPAAEGRAPADVVLEAYRAGQSRESGRIIGGVDVAYAAHPWQVALVRVDVPDNFEGQFCGGSYLGGKYVLTAAHCVGLPESAFEVFYGTASLGSGGRRVKVRRKIPHDGYDSVTKNADIAILELEQSLQTGAIAPLKPAELSQILSGALISVTGWGVIDDVGSASRTLKGVNIPLQTMATCNAPDAYNGAVTPNMLCAGHTIGGQDICTGDSGGPATALVQGTRKLVGVISWTRDCAAPKRYGVYTRVSNYASWIADNTRP